MQIHHLIVIFPSNFYRMQVFEFVRDHPVFDWLSSERNCLKGQTVKDFSKQIRRLASDNKLMVNLQSSGEMVLQDHDIKKSIEKLADLYTEIT